MHRALVPLLLLLLAGAAPAPPRLLVTVTEVRPTAAIVWARAAHAGAVTVEVGPTGGDSLRSLTAQAAVATDLIVRVPLDGLAPATHHRYHVRQAGARVEGEFITAPLPAESALQAVLRHTSVYATWDDHEVSNDFAGTTEPRMPMGRQAFLDYWPVAAGDDPTRIYRSVRWGRLLEIFILDTRQYRSDNGLPDGPGKTMLGAAQRRWLLDALPVSTATWMVVVSSVPLSVPTGRPERRDGWSNASVFGLAPETGTGFVTERDAILREFRVRGVRNVIVLAGDVHHAEIIRHQPHRGWAVPRVHRRPAVGAARPPAPAGRAAGATHAVRAGRRLQLRRGHDRPLAARGATRRRAGHRDVHPHDHPRPGGEPWWS